MRGNGKYFTIDEPKINFGHHFVDVEEIDLTFDSMRLVREIELKSYKDILTSHHQLKISNAKLAVRDSETVIAKEKPAQDKNIIELFNKNQTWCSILKYLPVNEWSKLHFVDWVTVKINLAAILNSYYMEIIDQQVLPYHEEIKDFYNNKCLEIKKSHLSFTEFLVYDGPKNWIKKQTIEVNCNTLVIKENNVVLIKDLSNVKRIILMGKLFLQQKWLLKNMIDIEIIDKGKFFLHCYRRPNKVIKEKYKNVMYIH
jgi:hypothetical protein